VFQPSTIRRVYPLARYSNGCRRGAGRADLELLERRCLLSAAVSFGPTEDISLSSKPAELAVASLTGDGKQDIVTLNYGGTVSVIMGNGDGTFQPPKDIPDGLSTTSSDSFTDESLAVADLGNGRPDIIASDVDSGEVSILMGNGNGTFKAPFAVPATNQGASGPNVEGISVADMNGDGIPDLITVNSNGSVSVLLGNGNGTFRAPVTTPVFANENAAFLDVLYVNGRLKPDLLVGSRQAGEVELLPGRGNGKFHSPQSVANFSQKYREIGGFTADGTFDLVVASANGAIDVVSGNNDGSFQSPVQILTTGTSTTGFLVGDFVGDGNSDLLISSGSGKSYLLAGNGDGTFQQAQTFSILVPKVNNEVKAVDLTGDGKADLLVAYSSPDGVGVRLNTTPGITVPGITSEGSATFAVRTASTFLVTSSGTPAATLMEAGQLPSGVSFVEKSNGKAKLTGTPAAGTGGVYAIQISASNGVSNTSQSFVLTVDQAPAITSASSDKFGVGAFGSFMFTTSGFPAVALSASGNFDGLTFVNDGNGTATLSGTPILTGKYRLTIKAKNGNGPTAKQTFTFKVRG
jgi:FG-GAP-like repeat